MSTDFVAWLSLIVSAFAIIVSGYTWKQTHEKSKYDIADAILTDLLKLGIEYPEFRDESHIVAALNHTDAKVRCRYDAYATLVWNYLETLYDSYGEKLLKSPFYGAMHDLGNAHKAWFFADDRYHSYHDALPKFLKLSNR